MRLPHHLVESLYFTFPDRQAFLFAYGGSEDETKLIEVLAGKGLPPITSMEALATMLGLNSGVIWSFINRPNRHYNSFPIKKGNGERQIHAPRVALKVLQKWLSVHLARAYSPPDHVFGFVPGRSHIYAALRHSTAEWALSVDIAEFFPSTPQARVVEAYVFLGYSRQIAGLLASLSCFHGVLAQGAPTSPVLSNICFRELDASLIEIARQFEARLTRYADDIVFSGSGTLPAGMLEAVQAVFAGSPWTLRNDKTRVEPLKGRIKVHGLVVGGGQIRLTKGYRNQLRAYSHILRTRDRPDYLDRLLGHVEYARQVSKMTGKSLDEFSIDDARRAKLRLNRKAENGDATREGETHKTGFFSRWTKILRGTRDD